MKKQLKQLLKAAAPFTAVHAWYMMRKDGAEDDLFATSVGHFFQTGGSFGPEFSAQIQFKLGDWRKLNKAYADARDALLKAQKRKK